jgi:hypothetical protein
MRHSDEGGDGGALEPAPQRARFHGDDPAALLTQQRRTQTIFTYVMVAIGAISLLVGGIGMVNIVPASA